MIQAAPAVYPGGVMVRNNYGGPVDAATVGAAPPPAPEPTPPVAPPAPAPWSGYSGPAPAAQAAPVIAAVAAMQPQQEWGAAPAPAPAPYPQAPQAPPVATHPGPRPMPEAVPAAVQAALAQATAQAGLAQQPPTAYAPAPTAYAPAPTAYAPAPAPAPVAATPPPRPEPKTPWGKRGSSLADYTFQVVTALLHLFEHGKLHLGWSSPSWNINSYGLEWGWVRLTTTAEAEAVLLRLPPEEVSAEARAALARPKGLHRHKELPAIQEALNKLGEFPEIARSLQLEHFTTRVYSPADDVARSLAEVSPIAWLIAANTVRLGGALAIREAAFPNGATKPTDWSKWLDAQEAAYKPVDKPVATLETLRLLAKSNPLLDFVNAIEVVDDEGRRHDVTAQAIFSPTGVIKGGVR